MATIIITRHYSGFTNVEDTLEIGSHEYNGNAAATVYRLPEGYSTQNDVLYDCDGIECALYLDRGKVIADSWIGTRKTHLVEAQ